MAEITGFDFGALQGVAALNDLKCMFSLFLKGNNSETRKQ